MPPNSDKKEYTGVLDSYDVQTGDGDLYHDITVAQGADDRKRQYIWTNIAVFALAHVNFLYALYLVVTGGCSVYTSLFALATYFASGIGITGGVHRLWSHRSYKANWGVQVFLMLMSTVAYENSVIHWAREHRVHHKYSETDADPVNSKRGFFFSHCGWLMVRKHPSVAIKGKGIDISDLTSNPVLAFQKKYYLPLMILCAMIIPALIPIYAWNESVKNAIVVSVVGRWIFGLHCTWLINSAAHKYGSKPYDHRLNPSNNHWVSIATLGEGFHNYHHVFPWDYKTSELGNSFFNLTTSFIEGCAKFGWTYDLQTVPLEMIEKRVKRTGDGTHKIWGTSYSTREEYDAQERIAELPASKKAS